jgi:hypothetical protein
MKHCATHLLLLLLLLLMTTKSSYSIGFGVWQLIGA